MKTRFLPLLAALFACFPLHAATINWTTSTVTAPADVSTLGTLVGAMNVGDVTNARTINGVIFAADAAGPGPHALGTGTVTFGNLENTFANFWLAADAGGDVAYAAALDYGRFNGSGTGTVTLGGLIAGQPYQVQLWITDTRTNFITRVRTVDGVSTTAGGPNIATGTFTADTVTQVITVASVGGFGPQVNLLQLRALPNTLPTISNIANQSTLEDTALTALAFTIGDTETAPAALTVSATSSNTTLLPDAAITFGGSGVNRTLTATPAANQYGSTTITVTVSDGVSTAQDVFTLTVSQVTDPPNLTHGTTNEDTEITGLVITPNAVDPSGITHFQITGITSGTMKYSDGTNLPNNTFVALAQAGAGLRFTPAANFHGTAGFHVQASSNNAVAGLRGSPVPVNITVLPVADNPTVTSATTAEDTQTTSGLVISKNVADGPEVMHFKITGINNGGLFQNDGTTSIAAGSFLTAAEASAGLRFTPAANFHGSGSFTVQASTSADDTGLGGGAVRAITVTPVADPPSVTHGTTNEDTQITGLVISRNAVDGNEITHFQITGITSGTLRYNDNTALNNNTFVASAQAGAGLRFTPAANFHGTAGFTVQASTSNAVAGLSGSQVPVTITVLPVADTPSVTNATTAEDTQSTSGLVISTPDGPEITHFKITGITNGALFQNDGTTPIAAGTFITFAEANAGLKFTPAAHFYGSGSFSVQASTSADDTGLGGGTATASITVTQVTGPPSVTHGTTPEDTEITGLVISPHVSDGPEITHFRITGITNGTMRRNDNVGINNNSFITRAQAGAGLKFTPAANFNGAAGFTVQASNSNAAAGLSGDPVPVTVTVLPVNDAPTFTAGASQIHTPNPGPQTVPGWATGMSTGPAAESGQSLLGFTISSNSLPGLFSTPPAVAPDGTLTYTPAAGATGFATIGVTLRDDGGTDNGGSDSRTRTFTIVVKNPILVTTIANSGAGSLRQAVIVAAASPGGDLIRFAPGLSGATIVLLAQISISDDLDIDATSLPAGLTLDGGPGTNRIFTVNATRTAAFRGLTLIGGNVGTGQGGAIDNYGACTLTRCTLTGNSASLGGAVYNNPDALLTLQHCTLTGNTASTRGGAIRVVGGTATLTHCTISGNTAPAGEGSGVASASSTRVQNCLISGNTNSSVDGSPITSLGGNLIGSGNATGVFNQPGDILNNAPQLAPLADNGGPTRTMRLLPGSPALNAATVLAPAITGDQRGFPIVGVRDIGAYEAGGIGIYAIPAMTVLEDSVVTFPVTLANPDGASLPSFTGSAVSGDQLLVRDEMIQVFPTGDPAVFDVSFPLYSEAYGTVTITLTLSDGVQSFATSFPLTIQPVNDAPWFEKGAPQAFLSTPGPQTVPGWATGMTPGLRANENTQTLTGFTVTNDNNALFSTPPAVAVDGTLTYTLAPGQMGVATVTVTLHDDGGTANGGLDTSHPQTFTIAVKNPIIVATHGDGVPGSLRQAVADAEASPGGDFIHFDPGLAGRTFFFGGSAIIVAGLDPIVIDASALSSPPNLRAEGWHNHFQFESSTHVTLDSLLFTKTSADPRADDGGAIENDGTLTLRRCTITGSRSTEDAGAIYSRGPLTLTGCTLTDCHADDEGGAIYADGPTTLTRCTFFGNTAGVDGGVIYQYGPLTATHCTFSGNEASGEGGAVLHDGDQAVLAWCIVAGNTAPVGADIRLTLREGTSLAAAGTNLIGDNDTVSAIFPAGPLAGTTAAPLDPRHTGGAYYYGGPTQTTALLFDSPARNAATGSPATADQRGYPIVGVPDLGAYEAGTVNTYGIWQAETIDPDRDGPNGQGYYDDPDDDGLDHTWEYATRSDPHAFTPDPLTATPAPGGGMVFTFPWNPLATDLRYRLQESPDLGTWSDLYQNDRTTSQIIRAPGVTSDETTTPGLITVTIPTATGARTFWKLHIEQP